MNVILGIDPGALRLGWGLIDHVENGYELLASGIDTLKREVKPNGKNEEAQLYRRRLIEFYTVEFGQTLDLLIAHAERLGRPPKVAFETLPIGGGGDAFRSGSSQSEFAKAVVTVCQTLCVQREIEWELIAANSVKLRVTGWGDATKAQVRDAVIGVFPELEERKAELTTKGADEADGIAVALAGAGYKVSKAKVKNPRRRAKKES